MSQLTFDQMFTSCLLGLNPQESKLKLDWKEYFHKFLEEHGEPVPWQGRLLFSDGWQYSSTDYQGPEYPPPKGIAKLKSLQVSYWSLIHEVLLAEIRRLESEIKMLIEWQEHKSMPLQQRVSYLSETERGLVIRKKGDPEDLDFSGLEYALEDKKHRRDQAASELEKLGQTI